MAPMHSGNSSFPRVCFLLAALVLLTTAGWPQEEPTSSQSLYGTWYTYPLGNPKTDTVRYEFRHDVSTNRDEIIVTRHCPVESRVVVAKAVAPIEVTDETIRILKTAVDSQPTQGTWTCDAGINAGVFSYSFADDHVVLTNPGGNPDYLELAREEKTTAPAVPQMLYGTWLLPAIDGKTMRMQVRWVFYPTAERQDRLRQIAVCTQGNDSLVSQVDTDVDISPHYIKVLQSASHDQQQGSFVCQASILAATWRYTLAPTGVTLTLFANGAKPITLTRESQTGLN
jgi:hypothetical protein